MISPQALMRGIVKRLASNIASNADNGNVDVAVRMFPYGEVCTQPMVRKQHVLADEGTYFVANNNQTGVAPAVVTATTWTAVNSMIMIYNGNTAPSQGQNLYLDYINLIATAQYTQTAGATTAYVAAAVTIDNINRFASGGTVLTPQNPNMGLVANASGCTVYAGAVPSAASGSARTIVGLRNIRTCVSASFMNVIGDAYQFNFGGVETTQTGNLVVANANIIPIPMPPVIVSPGGTFLLHLWAQGATTPGAATFAPEVGFFVR